MNYLLTPEGVPVPEPDLVKWYEANKGDPHVANDEIGAYLISTIFLRSDHGSDPRNPLLWETMVFKGGDWSGDASDRCSGTRTDAEAMHQRMCERVRTAIADGKEL